MGAGRVCIWGKASRLSILQVQGPKAGQCLTFSKDSKKANEAEAEEAER